MMINYWLPEDDDSAKRDSAEGPCKSFDMGQKIVDKNKNKKAQGSNRPILAPQANRTWLWVRKGQHTQPHLGFPATAAVDPMVPVKKKLCDSRPLAEVLRGGQMNRDTCKTVVDPMRDHPGKREVIPTIR
jgi:hypothetical protein